MNAITENHQPAANSHQGENGNTEENNPPPEPSWKDFKKYFWHDGNLRTLLATSFCWFCVDLPCKSTSFRFCERFVGNSLLISYCPVVYGLGMNSPRIISVIWYGSSPPPNSIYSLLVHNVWQSLVVVSIGAIVGCAITFVAIDKLGRRNIQIIGFFWLFILFIVIGGSFNHLYEVGGSSAIIVLYILCQIFFNFGPNTITYIVSRFHPFQLNQHTDGCSYPLSSFQPGTEVYATASPLHLES